MAIEKREYTKLIWPELEGVMNPSGTNMRALCEQLSPIFGVKISHIGELRFKTTDDALAAFDIIMERLNLFAGPFVHYRHPVANATSTEWGSSEWSKEWWELESRLCIRRRVAYRPVYVRVVHKEVEVNGELYTKTEQERTHGEWQSIEEVFWVYVPRRTLEVWSRDAGGA